MCDVPTIAAHGQTGLVLSFLVLASRTGERLRASDIDRMATQAWQRLPYEPASHVRWMATGGRIALLAWDLHRDGDPPGPRWFADERGITAFGGYAHPIGGRWRSGSWARQLGELYPDGVLRPGVHPCWGMFTMVRLTEQGAGFVTPDPLSMGHVFRSTTTDLEAISNRADLAAIAADTYEQRDPEGLGWLLVYEYIVDVQTSFRGVRRLKTGIANTIDADGAVHEIRVDGDRWYAEPPEYGDILPIFADDLRDHMATVAGLDRPVQLSLTGGRDSRLVLALAVAAGVEKSFGYMTAESFPGELDPDVHVAEMVAQRFGLQHRVMRMDHSSWTPAEFEQRVRLHAHTTSAMMGAKGPRNRLAIRAHTQVSGAFGENLTGSRSGDGPTTTVEDACSFMEGKMYGGGRGFLHPEAREHYVLRLRAMFDELAADGTAPDELPYRFYVDNYLQGGIPREVEIPGINPNVEPLYSVHLPTIARAAGWYGRRHHRIHFDLMREASRELAQMPFAGFSWPEPLLEGRSDADSYRNEPVLYSGEMRALRGRRWQDHVDVYRTYLLGDRNGPMNDLLDLGMVEEVLAGTKPMPGAGLLQLNNALGAAVWLAGAEETSRVTAADVDRAYRKSG